jgi:hypothetical protein
MTSVLEVGPQSGSESIRSYCEHFVMNHMLTLHINVQSGQKVVNLNFLVLIGMFRLKLFGRFVER